MYLYCLINEKIDNGKTIFIDKTQFENANTNFNGTLFRFMR